MDDFAEWIGSEPTWFYSWSMSDIRQFQTESTFKEYKGPIIARMESHWTDFQEVYSELLGINKKIKLKQAVTAADYEFTGAQHTALADAVNTAEILRLSKDADKFETRYECRFWTCFVRIRINRLYWICALSFLHLLWRSQLVPSDCVLLEI